MPLNDLEVLGLLETSSIVSDTTILMTGNPPILLNKLTSALEFDCAALALFELALLANREHPCRLVNVHKAIKNHLSVISFIINQWSIKQ